MIPSAAHIAPLALMGLTACTAPPGGNGTVASSNTGALANTGTSSVEGGVSIFDENSLLDKPEGSSIVTVDGLDYLGVETRLLAGDLVRFRVAVRGPNAAESVTRYAECAAAEYTLIRGFGFARHIRTNVGQTGEVWSADAVYTISPALPDGIKNLDAEVVAADCAENGIPRV